MKKDVLSYNVCGVCIVFGFLCLLIISDIKIELCYFNNHFVDNLGDNYKLQRKNRY